MIERKTFTFDGENSADYGLYISGDSVYNAPNREIDMVSIPGRNGQLAIDMGRYENITVTYPAFVIADTQAEFREKIRRIRNWLCSKTSYQRLTDDYNPESFRLGLYKSGLEVEPIFYNRCGEFKMSFDCQPQRFLFEGEEVFTLGEWGETETYSGSIVSFEGTETTAIKSLIANITPKQSGSGDPSPSNVRPISGYTEVEVTDSGKNLIDLDLPYATPSEGATNRFATNFVIPKVGKFIRGSGKCSDGTILDDVAIVWLNANNSQVWNIGANKAWQVPSNIDEVTRIRLYTPSKYAGKTVTEFQIEYVDGETSTATEYVPFNGESKSISLGQTVYGGTLDVVSGELVIDRMGYVFNGTESIAVGPQQGYPRFSASNVLPDKPNYLRGQWCSHFKPTTTVIGTNAANNGISGYSEDRHIYWRADEYATVEDMKAYLLQQYQNGTPVTYVSYFKTPQTVQLTPTQVKTLLGNNNIFADSGSVEVEIGENPYILVNPTKFEACPIFEVEGAGSLSIGDTTLTISNTGTTIIDTEMMEAYEDDNGAIISRNDEVEGGFPTLNSGVNTIDTDGLTSVKVTPKWWEL